MLEIPNAPVNDLLSTGYFYEELKKHIKSTDSKEIDLVAFSRDFALPYLVKKTASYKGHGQTNRARILDLAVKFLSDADDSELPETFLALKKVAGSEVAVNEKEISTTDQPRIAQLCRQRSESAQSLKKLLTSIIKMYRLAQIIDKKDKSEQQTASVEDTIVSYWEMSLPPD